jgi:hypothetical protein
MGLCRLNAQKLTLYYLVQLYTIQLEYRQILIIPYYEIKKIRPCSYLRPRR